MKGLPENPQPKIFSDKKWAEMWRTRKDWTYFSRRALGSATTRQSVAFFEAVNNIDTDNIPAAGQFPNAYNFYLAKLGITIMPKLDGTIATATIYQAVNTVILNSSMQLKVVNETFFQKPVSGMFSKVSIAPDGTVKMCSGELDVIGSMVLNKAILFTKGTAFNFDFTTVTGLDCSSLIAKIEIRMSGFLITE